MLANWVKQAVASAPGTGNITLGGAFSGFVGLGDVMRDGELFNYTVIDGDNRETGVATFQVTGGVVERTWPRQTLLSGALDMSNPAPISLTANAVVFIAPSADMLVSLPTGQADYPDVFSNHVQCHSGSGNNAAIVADRQYMVPYHLPIPLDVTGIAIDIDTAIPGSVSRLGLSQLFQGAGVDGFIAEAAVDTTASGRAVATVAAGLLKPGWYGLHLLSDSAINIERISGTSSGWTPTRKVNASSRWAPGQLVYADIPAGWSVLSAASSVTTQEYNNSAPNIWLTGNRI